MSGSIIACPSCGKKNRVRAVSSGIPQCASCHQPLPWMVDATAQSFDEELRASVPVLVDFWAPWCGPCKMIEPSLDTLSKAHARRLKIVRLNIDNAPAIAARHGVQGIPLLMIARDGREVDRLVGAAPLPRIDAWLQPHLQDQSSSPT